MQSYKYAISRNIKIDEKFRRTSALLAVSCALMSSAAQAQNAGDAGTSASIPREATTTNKSESLLGTVKRPPRPLPVILGMVESQQEKLERIYAEFAIKRIEQERKIANWQSDLQKAQSPTSFDERKAAGLLKSLNAATQKITDAFLRARGQALGGLSPAQRAQLQNLAQQETNASVSPGAPALPAQDEYYHLLLMPVERLLGTPVDTQAVRRLAARQADRDADFSYGLGYGYGGSSGIFGGYGRGGFGFGFGFGNGHRRRYR